MSALRWPRSRTVAWTAASTVVCAAIVLLLPGATPALRAPAAVAVAALVVGHTAIILRVGGRRMRELAGRAASLRRDGRIDLTTVVAGAESEGEATAAAARAIDDLTGAINALMLEIVSASKKFSLFSADIYYSGQHLSEVSDAQAGLMVQVVERADGFEREMQGLVAAIGACLTRMHATARSFETLRERTAAAEERLAPLTGATEEAGTLAAAGLELMAASHTSTTELRSAVARLNERTGQMDKRTSQIGRVIAGLQDIADTTHVLATNASIEAARAGHAGRGFAVIASEIRALASASRTAIGEVSDFLTRIAQDIRESSSIAGESAERVAELEGLSSETGASLGDIAARVGQIGEAMAAFRDMFGTQAQTIARTISESEEIHRLVGGVGDDIERQAQGYAALSREVSQAGDGARGAAHSARVLSQLGTYLRTGGQELSHLVETVSVSRERFLGGLARKEPRTTLLYNLEMIHDGALLGHLGDISPSGLMLYSAEALPVGTPIVASIRLPLTSGNVPDVEVCFVPRRNEKQPWFFKVGCSIDLTRTAGGIDTKAMREGIELIISSYTVTQGIEQLAEMGIGADAPPTGTPVSGGRPVDHDAAEALEMEAMDDLEEVEPLEELGELDDLEEIEDAGPSV